MSDFSMLFYKFINSEIFSISEDTLIGLNLYFGSILAKTFF
jgi:hypothetical protein